MEIFEMKISIAKRLLLVSILMIFTTYNSFSQSVSERRQKEHEAVRNLIHANQNNLKKSESETTKPKSYYPSGENYKLSKTDIIWNVHFENQI